jgi:acyl-CoA thioester hydrolase
LETWRGAVGPWHIDQMGHMNIRFYVAIAMEAMTGLAGALGMPRAFTAGAAATLQVRELHVRFLKEARLGAGLHMESAVLEMGETDARVLQVLFHSGSGEAAAAVVARVEHVTPHEQRPFPWTVSTRRLAETLRAAAPDYALPRGLTGAPARETASLAGADALGLINGASGALSPADCDVFARMRPDHLQARVGSAMPHQAHRAAVVVDQLMPELAGRLGGATVELRARYLRWPQAGDRLLLRSGLTALTPKTCRFMHWLLDPASGKAWAEAEMLIVNFDLEARRAVALSAPVLEALQPYVVKRPS